MICCSCVWRKDRRSLSSSLEPLVFTIKKLALRTNDIKIYSAIKQSYCIIHTFNLHWTLPKYLRTFLHGNVVLTIGLTDQSDYSIRHFMVRIFIRTLLWESHTIILYYENSDYDKIVLGIVRGGSITGNKEQWLLRLTFILIYPIKAFYWVLKFTSV